MASPTHYSILGVEPDATQAQIQRAYRALAKAQHPDVNASANAAKVFARIAAAYAVLSDALKRRAYDQSLREPTPRTSNERPGQAHYTWTNIAAQGAAEAARANREEEIDELYDTFFAPSKTSPTGRSATRATPARPQQAPPPSPAKGKKRSVKRRTG